MKGILTKLEKKSGSDYFAIGVPVEIMFKAKPVVGYPFYVVVGTKAIRLTEVQEIRDIFCKNSPDFSIIYTKNSVYKLEPINEEKSSRA